MRINGRGIRRTPWLALWIAPACARGDSPYLYGIHWWGYSPGRPIDTAPAALLDCPAYGGWDVETVLTHSASWWSASFFRPLYADLYTNRNISIITRIDYDWGQTVPSPTNPDYAGWPAACATVMNTLRDWAHIWIIGNEPNIVGEGNGWPNNQITPAGYAAIYRSVRSRIRSAAGPSPAGPHRVLIAPPSPGGIIPGVRWMAGNDWLAQVIDNIPADEIDGFALHAYGGSVADFHWSYVSQLSLIDSKGLHDKPCYITEWNRYAAPGSPAEEAAAATFCREAFADLNAWNQTPGNHNVVSLCWFVYDADDQAGGVWNGYSIEYWKSNGNPAGNPGDLYTAFAEAVDQRYPAGRIGTYYAPPTAAFAASPTAGLAPLRVGFTDQSTGIVTSRLWSFGDGATSTESNPVHVFAQPGSYSVSLTVTGPGGSDTLTKTDFIVARAPSPDYNDDGDVDVNDFAFFQLCFNGPNVPPAYTFCDETDLDRDGDVDVSDFARFQTCFNGPDRPPACP